MEKYFIIYRTTNRLNGRYYIGMHVTGNIEDGYLGSGKRLKAEIKKYGRQNFDRTVLEFCVSKEHLASREAELVTEKLRLDPLCLNLKNGGCGDWSYVHEIRAHSIGAVNANRSPNRDHTTLSQKSLVTKRARGSGNWFGGKYGNFRGKSPSIEHRKKIGKANAIAQAGEKNSQFGTCWVTNGTAVKIKKQQLDEYLSMGYSRGRKRG